MFKLKHPTFNFHVKTPFKQALYYLVLLIAVSLSSGCTFKVKLVGQYDELVDQTVLNLQSETGSHLNTVLETKGKAEGSYTKSKEFYSRSIGKVNALITRAKVLEDKLKRTPLTDNFEALKQQYQDLQLLHQTPFNENAISSAQKAMQQSFHAIVQHLVFLKWNQKQPEE